MAEGGWSDAEFHQRRVALEAPSPWLLVMCYSQARDLVPCVLVVVTPSVPPWTPLHPPSRGHRTGKTSQLLLL